MMRIGSGKGVQKSVASPGPRSMARLNEYLSGPGNAVHGGGGRPLAHLLIWAVSVTSLVFSVEIPAVPDAP